MKWLFLLHIVTTLMMVAIIWFVQIVHYPLFAAVGEERFVAYERRHTVRISWIVGPLMVMELLSGLGLLVLQPFETGVLMQWIGMSLIGIIWLSTALLQVPQHRQLSEGFSPKVLQVLVNTNWIRTIAWTLRGLLVIYWLERLF